MKIANWMKLTPRQQHVMLLAMQVRNAMEDFHVEHLSDAQMKQLNPIIRQALYDAVSMIEEDDLDERAHSLGYLVAMIPEYWEIPEGVSSDEDRARTDPRQKDLDASDGEWRDAA